MVCATLSLHCADEQSFGDVAFQHNHPNQQWADHEVSERAMNNRKTWTPA